MQISTEDERFWTAEAVDGNLNCNYDTAWHTDWNNEDKTIDACYALGSGNSYGGSDLVSADGGDLENWEVPYEDDDETDYWCTKANTSTEYSVYECTQIKCPVQRKLDTDDTASDIPFIPTASAPDVMVIRPGRARLNISHTHVDGQVNDPSTDHGVQSFVTTDIQINVYAGASSLIAGCMAAAMVVGF